MPECRDDIARTFFEPGSAERSPRFSDFFWRFAGPSAGRQGHLSASGGPPVVPAGSAGGARVLRRNPRFGETKIELLRRFLPFKDGTPSHDQLGDIFAMIDATHFQ